MFDIDFFATNGKFYSISRVKFLKTVGLTWSS